MFLCTFKIFNFFNFWRSQGGGLETCNERNRRFKGEQAIKMFKSKKIVKFFKNFKVHKNIRLGPYNPGWDSLTETETETRRFFIFRS